MYNAYLGSMKPFQTKIFLVQIVLDKLCISFAVVELNYLILQKIKSPFMQLVKYVCAATILLASCRGIRQNTALPTDVDHLPMAYAVSPKALLTESAVSQHQPEKSENPVVGEINEDDTQTKETSSTVSKSVVTKKVHSFAEWKKMAKTGELQMSKKDIKMLNKLDKKYNGNFEKFKADTFEFTDKAKIVAGVGILGLLLVIFTGSWFGAFLLILAALGFILRFLGVIDF